MTEQPKASAYDPGFVALLDGRDKTELLDKITELAMRVRELERRVAELSK